MRLLLDTHVWLWWAGAHPRLKGDSARLIADPDNEVFLSAASAWEMAIKKTHGKLNAPDDVAALLARDQMASLPITVPHALHAGSLPDVHRDPFDRMLVAQARLENLTLVTADPVFDRYPVSVLPA